MTSRRIVLDTVGANYPEVTNIQCLKFGYLNGAKSAWTAAQIDEQHRRGELLALFDVLGDSPHQAAIVDWERGDVQDPARLRWWVEQRNEYRGDAVVYANRDGMPRVLAALNDPGLYYRLLIADLTDNGQPPINPPDFGLPPQVRLLGVQYAWSNKTGGPYDLSILFDGSWHATQEPVHLTAAAAQAPAADAPAAVDPDPLTAASFRDSRPAGQPVAVSPIPDLRDAVGTVAPPKSGGMTSSAAPSTNWALALTTMASDPDSPTPGRSGATAQDAAGTPATGEVDPLPPLIRPYVPAHTAVSPHIDHDAVYDWIQEGQKVAGSFRTAGAGQLAGQLEQILGGMLEVGRLLSALGR